MNAFRTNAGLVVMLALGSATLHGCRQAVAQSTPAPKPTLELTVYKNDFAMVHDERKIDLTAGTSALRLPGVSKQLDPQSVLFDWPGKGSHPDVLSTTYNLGVGSSEDLLKRLVGQKVEMVWRGQDGRVGDKTTGVLEEAGQGTVLHTDDSYLVNPGGEVVASANQTISTMPELVASVNSGTPFDSDVSLSYLTRGMSWTADYVGKIDPDGKKMRLECWGTITNTTGTDFPAAKLNLVAGNPNRDVSNSTVVPGQGYGGLQMANNKADVTLPAAGRVMLSGAPAISVGDLYTYKLTGHSDVMQQQMNRARILSSEDVPIVRTYSIALGDVEGDNNRQSAQVSISFTNDVKSGLGQPLPEGAIRTYESDGGEESYTGAAEIGDVPKDERINLTLSDAFDVYAKSSVGNYRKLGKHSFSRTYTVVVHNEKKNDEKVRIADSFDEGTRVTESSIPAKKLSAGSYEWQVPVKAGGQTTLTFTVQHG